MGGYEVGVCEFWNSGKRRKALVFLFLDISISSRSLMVLSGTRASLIQCYVFVCRSGRLVDICHESYLTLILSF